MASPLPLDALHRPGSARHLGLVRVVFCLHLLTVLASPVIPTIYSVGHAQPWARSLIPDGAAAVIAAWFMDLLVPLGILACLLSVIGLLLRVSLPVLFGCFLLTQDFYYRASLFHDDWLYFNFFLLVLCLSRCGDAMALDRVLPRALARLRGRRPPSPPAPIVPVAPHAYRWPIEVMLFWLAGVYVAAGLAKLFPLHHGMLWFTGRRAQELAMEFLLESPIYWLLGQAPFDLTVRWPFTVAAALTVAVELSAALIILRPRLRPWIWLSLFGMHCVIYLCGIPGFVQISLAYSVLFLPPAWFSDYIDEKQPAGL